jgi:hypothetical protein
MNDDQEPTRPTLSPMPPRMAHKEFDSISDVANERLKGRGQRRAVAINAVQMAREQGGRGKETWTTEESDILVAIMDLLDKVAGT